MQDKITELIITTAAQLGKDELSFGGDLDADTRLFGKDGALDSMGLVTLIVAVEQAIEDELDESVALADEKALSQARSPYRTVSTLAAYATEQLQES